MVFRALLSLFASNWRFLLDDPPVTLSGSKVQVINDASLTVACFRVRAPVRDWLYVFVCVSKRETKSVSVYSQ